MWQRGWPVPQEPPDRLQVDCGIVLIAVRHADPHACDTFSEAARDGYPSSVSFSILVWAAYQECDVVRILVCAGQDDWTARRPESLTAALVRVRVASAATRTDTQGRRTEPPHSPWEDFVTLADPHIRIAVRACGCRARDVEECVQEAWLQVVKCVDRVHTDPGRGSLACWLQTVARRSAARFLRRQARVAASASHLAAQCPWLHNAQRGDPYQPDPAAVCARRESLAVLAASVDSLRTVLGERADRLVRHYLADHSSLTCLTSRLDVTPGQFWHLWRTVKTFLRDRLEPLEE